MELAAIPFERGRIVWQRSSFDASLLIPRPTSPAFGAADESFLIGEVLTNLYVGLGRFARGELLSAFFFIQHHAVVRLIELLELWSEKSPKQRDRFSNERRFETRFPQHTALIASLTPGSADSPTAAERMLTFLASRISLNERIVLEIRALIDSVQ